MAFVRHHRHLERLIDSTPLLLPGFLPEPPCYCISAIDLALEVSMGWSVGCICNGSNRQNRKSSPCRKPMSRPSAARHVTRSMQTKGDNTSIDHTGQNLLGYLEIYRNPLRSDKSVEIGRYQRWPLQEFVTQPRWPGS